MLHAEVRVGQRRTCYNYREGGHLRRECLHRVKCSKAIGGAGASVIAAEMKVTLLESVLKAEWRVEPLVGVKEEVQQYQGLRWEKAAFCSML